MLNRLLMAIPDDMSWNIRSPQEYLVESGSAGKSCPAHPSNNSCQRLGFKQNNWQFNTVGENQKEKCEEGVVVRCSVHDSVHTQWLVEQGREGQMEKEEAGALLCEEDKEGRCLLSLSDFDVQQEAAMWNVEATSRSAHFMSSDFIQWLIGQASEGEWSKEEVGSIVCRKNADNQLILATFDEETQKEVAVFNPSETCSAVSYMEKEGDFLEWLYQEAVERRWDEHMVIKALVKEEVNGNVKITSRIKPGISLQITLSYPFPTTQSLR